MRRLVDHLAARQELVLVALLVMTVVMMILPMPTVFADVLIATNISIAMILLMVAIHIGSPVEFSTIPTVILLTTAFRLSLSITTSRMVLVQGDAGEIIRAFGTFVVAGNVVVGLVVYMIITIVQFLVITKGSERVAEVAARFTLDALPGKQLSIDTDVKNGDIDQKEARRRRRLLERESHLYGAMDGAMKFVKGDAIASLVIIVVNLIGGIAIGTLQRGLSFGEAVQTYSLLAVGDGLIAQIPALMISLTAGIIVTRVSSDEGGDLGREVLSQVSAEPRVLQIAALVLAGLGLVPGFPKPVFFTLAILLGAIGWAAGGRRRRETARAAADVEAMARAVPEAAKLVVSVGPSLAGPGDALQSALAQARGDLSASLGIAIPHVRLATHGRDLAAWRLDLDGVPIASGEAETGVDELARAVGAVLARNAAQFVGIQETQALIGPMEIGYADLVREATRNAALPRLAEVLRRLVDEQVSVGNLRIILEAVAEWGGREQNTAVLAEHARAALRRQICHRLANEDGTLTVILVDGALDELLRGTVTATPAGSYLSLDAAATDRLVAALRRQLDQAANASILASTEVRRHLRALLARRGLVVPVLAHGELAPELQVQVAATLRPSDMAPARSDMSCAREDSRVVPLGAAALTAA